MFKYNSSLLWNKVLRWVPVLFVSYLHMNMWVTLHTFLPVTTHMKDGCKHRCQHCMFNLFRICLANVL